MAKNFGIKSFNELRNLANSYGTDVVDLDQRNAEGVYTIDGAPEEFNNIVRFLYNATILDSEALEWGSENTYFSENIDGNFLSKMLLKYYESGIEDDDIIALDNWITNFNKRRYKDIQEDPLGMLYEMYPDSDILQSGLILQIRGYLLSKIKEMTDAFDSKGNEKLTLKEWLGVQDSIIVEDDSPANASYSGSEIFEYIVKNKIIESFLFPIILGYTGETSETINGTFSILLEDYVGGETLKEKFKNELDPEIADRIDSIESYYSVTKLGTSRELDLNSRITSYYGKPMVNGDTLWSNYLSIPLFSLKETNTPENGTTTELILINSPVIFSNEYDTKEDISFKKIVKENALAIFNIVETLKNKLASEEEHFLGSSKEHFQTRLFSWIFELTQLMFDRYIVHSVLRLSPGSTGDERRNASLYESINTGDNNPLMLLDIKNIPLENNSKLSKYFLTKYGSVSNKENYPSTVIVKNMPKYLTFTILYKELNPYIAEHTMSDSLEIIFSRLLNVLTTGRQLEELLSLENSDFDVSFRSDLYNLIRTYKENNEIMLLDPSVYLVQNIYTNPYRFYTSLESDIAAYYIGNNLTKDTFIGNYGENSNERNEISNFLGIYKETRDYFYKVLMNKSFSGSPEYKLYEKFFISSVSLERFLSSKIDNIHNVDYFNEEDIYNFLESYGLGMLNKPEYNFSKITHDFKINTIRYFNDLVRLKGSKDVISVLTKILDVGDTGVDIGKFLLVEKDNGDGSEIVFIETPYTSDNMTKEISQALGKAETPYELFLKDDPYWNTDLVTEDLVKDMNINVTETKYMSLTLIDDIQSRYIQSRLLLSTINEIEKAFGLNEPDNILHKVMLGDGNIFSGDISIFEVFSLIRLLYKTIFMLILSSEGKSHDVGLTDSFTEDNSNFIGLNPDGIDEVLKQIKELTNASEKDMEEFTQSKKKKTLNSEDDITYNRINRHIMGNSYHKYSVRVNDSFFIKHTPSKKTKIFDKLQTEIFTNYKTDLVSSGTRNSFELIDPLLTGMSLVYIMKQINDETDKDEINSLRENLWSEIVRQNFITRQDGSYENIRDSDLTRETLNVNDFYYNLIEKIIQYPIQYYSGMFNNQTAYPSLEQNKNFRDFNDVVIGSLFSTKIDPIQVSKSDLEGSEVKLDYIEKIGLKDIIDNINILTTSQREEHIKTLSDEMLQLSDFIRIVYASEPFMQFNLSIPEEENSILSFIGSLVNVFLSYTTEIYYAKFRKIVSSRSETIEYAESINHTLESEKEDYVFYDEALTIEEVKE